MNFLLVSENQLLFVPSLVFCVFNILLNGRTSKLLFLQSFFRIFQDSHPLLFHPLCSLLAVFFQGIFSNLTLTDLETPKLQDHADTATRQVDERECTEVYHELFHHEVRLRRSEDYDARWGFFRFEEH